MDTEMEKGKIKRVTDKGFGFISTDGSNNDMFFHSSSVEGVEFNDLREGQEVTYTVGQGPKGPRAENVQLVGH
nr:cold shock domain-containing protein [Rhodopirellula sp. SM50]